MRKSPLFWSLLCFCWFVLASAVFAGPGSMDPSYSAEIFGPTTPSLRAMALQPDGRLVIGGFLWQVNGHKINFCGRLNPDGSRDLSFTGATLTIEPYALAVLSDGSLLVGGRHAVSPEIPGSPTLYRLRSDGTLDETFATHVSGGIVHAIQVQPDGKIMVGGAFEAVQGASQRYLIRLNEDGTLDPSFAPSLDKAVYTLATQSDGKVLAGGGFTVTVAGQPQPGIARWNADGSLDESFKTTLATTVSTASVSVNSLAVSKEGRILIGGYFQKVNGSNVGYCAQLQANGQLVNTSTGMGDIPQSLAFQSDGKMLIATNSSTGVMRRLSTGGLDSTFVRELTATRGIALQNDGRVVASLIRANQSDTAQNLITRLDNNLGTISLAVVDGTRIVWQRGTAAADFTFCYFDLSTDGGNTWSRLGSGSPVSGGWELNGIALPSSGLIRARGRISGGYYNGSSGLVESLMQIEPGQPVLTIKSPTGTLFPSSNASFDFANERRISKSFMIGNAGTAPLTITEVSISDREAFSVNTSGLPPSLQPGEELSFEVLFDPPSEGSWEKSLTVRTNAAMQTVTLRGTGALSNNTSLISLSAHHNLGATLFPQPVALSSHAVCYFYPPNNARHFNLSFTTAPGASTSIDGEDLGSNPQSRFYYDFSFEGPSHYLEILVTAENQTASKVYRVNFLRRPAEAGEVDAEFANRPGDPVSAYWKSVVVMPGSKLIASGSPDSNSSSAEGIYEFGATGQPELRNPIQGGDVKLNSLPLSPGSLLLTDQAVSGIEKFPVIMAPSGAIDPAFKLSGITGYCRSSLVLPDGKILIGSGSSGFTTFGNPLPSLLRLLPDGKIDPAFKCTLRGACFTIAREPDGHLMVGGNFTNHQGQSQGYLLRLNEDGSMVWSPEQPQPNGAVTSIESAPEGKWLVSGEFNVISGTQCSRLVRFTAGWQLDNTFSANPSALASMSGFAVQANGEVIIANEDKVTKLNNRGQIITPFTPVFTGSNRSITLQADGRAIVSGSFSMVNGLPREGIARLVNDPATEELTVPSSDQIQWLRGGTTPEARRVLFEISTDAGNTWTFLKEGVRIPGGWEAAGTALPAQGLIRGRAVVSGGYLNSSSGLVQSASLPFQFGAPALTVSLDEIPLISGMSEVGFATAVIKTGVQRRVLTLANTGGTPLKGLAAQITGKGAAQFRIPQAPSNLVAAGNTTELIVEFAPGTLGTHAAQLTITSSTANIPVFALALTGEGIKASALPVVTLPATGLARTSATLQGSFSLPAIPDGQQVWFEFGPTNKLGTTIPAQASQEDSTTFAATITELLPHTPYFYRLTTGGPLGTSSGKTLSFTTLNEAPAGSFESLSVAKGCNAVLSPLSSTSDADGDPLSLHTIVPSSSANRIKAAKKGNDLSVTVPANATVAEYFTYTVKDGYGGVSAAIELSITPVSPSLGWSEPFPAAGNGLSFTFPASAYWTVSSYPSWLKPEAKSGYSPSINFEMTANGATTPRSGTVKIGASSYTITQNGAEGPPVLWSPSMPLPAATVGVAYELGIPTQNFPATYSVKNMPPGLSINYYGLISGRPTKAGRYDLEIRAKNAMGAASETITFTLDVREFPQALTGIYEGWFISKDPQTLQPSGRYQLQVLKTGAFSGKIQFGTESVPIKGSVEYHGETGVFISSPVSKKGLPVTQANFVLDLNEPLEFTLAGATQGQIPILTESVKIPWNGKDVLASAYEGLHTFTIMPSTVVAGVPAGYGFGAASVTGKTGLARLAGRLSDGTVFTSSAYAGQPAPTTAASKLAIHLPLYKNGGYYTGSLSITPGTTPIENQMSGTGYWIRPASNDRLNPEGFDRLFCLTSGSALPQVSAGGLALNAPQTSANALLTFTGAGLPESESLTATITNPSPRGITQKVTVSPGSYMSASLTKLDVKTGLFSGDLTVPGTIKALDRKTPYVGQIVRIGTNIRGYGFFLLPQLPTGQETLKTTLQLSGQVTLSPAASD